MKQVYLLFCLLVLSLISFETYGAPAKKKAAPDAEEVLKKGREAFLNYDFEEAEDQYSTYRELKAKAKESVSEEFEIWETELENASAAFERVQQIMIIDSILVAEKEFFKRYRLPQSAGSLINPSEIVTDLRNRGPVFFNEAGDYLLSSSKGTDGEFRLFETWLLPDGSQLSIESLEGDFDKTGDYSYPFMSADGQTLYFANNGEESIGGYDIFVAQKDPLTGEFLQPLNIGMPFNSPYDDYMMALDEENGIGWWATNRNAKEGFVNIYIYLLEDIRKNYPQSTENLADRAMIKDYKSTWEEGKEKEYKVILGNLPTTSVREKEEEPEFTFAIGNGKVYHSYTEFRNKKAATLMKQYIERKNQLEKREAKLLEMRRRYVKDKGLASGIIEEESKIEDERGKVRELANEIIKLEKAVR